MPPEIIEKKPMSADALPAFFPCVCIASEKLAAPMMDTMEIVTMSARMTSASGAWK